MPTYDPFQRGPSAVGVTTLELTDESRDRALPVEIWYPATDAHRGQDLEEESQDRYRPLPFAPEVSQSAVRDAVLSDGVRPLVVFSHGFGGERRQTTHLCTHWASHGYAVAAMDHVGNTTADMMQLAVAGSPPDPAEMIARFIADRPADASFVLDQMLLGAGPVSVDPARIGMSGHSFGGWTTLVTAGQDARVRAALPLAPAGGRTAAPPVGVSGDLADAMQLDWAREVPTLYLVADLDTILPLDGMQDLLSRTPAPCSGLVLQNADHFHFCDRVEETHDMFQTAGPMMAGGDGMNPDMKAMLDAMKPSSELCPGADAYALLQGLGLAHMDAHVRGSADAAKLLDQDLVELLAERGVAVTTL
jgi:dienelactone hydrolase